MRTEWCPDCGQVFNPYGGHVCSYVGYKPVCGELPPVAAIAARGLRSPGLVEWVWSVGGS